MTSHTLLQNLIPSISPPLYQNYYFGMAATSNLNPAIPCNEIIAFSIKVQGAYWGNIYKYFMQTAGMGVSEYSSSLSLDELWTFALF